MTLFKIDEKYSSHPNYPYRKHIKNIADSFGDESHKCSAMFHDLGKLCDAFQTYINPKHKNNRKTTHSFIGAFFYLVKQDYRLSKDSLPIFLSILKHHGNLGNVNEMVENLSDVEYLLDDYPELSGKLEEVKTILNSNVEINVEKFCEIFDTSLDFVEKNEFGGLEEYFRIKEIFSKLIFADKYEVIFKQNFKSDKFIDAEEYIERLVTHLSKKSNHLSSVRNSARKDILDNFSQNMDKSIFIIEAPTGIGKTFAALHLALEIVRVKRKKRIITALPMTSIIDQTFIEYSEIFSKDMLLKYHYLTSSKPRSTDERDELNSEQDNLKQKESYLTKSWAEDNVVITTFNQVLNLFYSNRNRDLIKFWTLRNSVIIMDEIQAIPRILLKDFSKTISFLSKQFNIDFILMSATIPDINNFLDSDLTSELLDNEYYSKDFNNRYSLLFDKAIDTEEKLIDAISYQFSEGKSVLSVVNTKKLALRLFQSLQKKHSENDVFLLSSYFIPKHRKEIITQISDNLRNKQKLILISTQVIEAGVDLDFDCGFREFSPLYSIIQTAGRVNRENRYELKRTAQLTICEQIGFSPYHQNDLLKEEVEQLLSEKVRENQLLPILKKYFEVSIGRTPPDMKLIPKMENLEFQNTAKIFNANYMQECPYLTQLFVEIEKGLYEKFYNKLEMLFEKLKDKTISLESKMEVKVDISDTYKNVMQFIINVPKIDVNDYEAFYEDSEMKVCRFENVNNCYNKVTGYLLSKSPVLVY